MSVVELGTILVFVEIVYGRTKEDGKFSTYTHHAGHCKVLHSRIMKLDSVQTAMCGFECHVLVLGLHSDVHFDPAIELVTANDDFIVLLRNEMVGKKFTQVVVHMNKAADWVCHNVTVTGVTDGGVVQFLAGPQSHLMEIDTKLCSFARFKI